MRTLEEIFRGESERDFLLDCRFNFQKWVTRVHGYEYKWFHKEWVDALESTKRIAILAPTGFGKTTILGVCFTLWKIFYIPYWQGLIVSNSVHQSTKVLEEIKMEIQENELMQRLIPDYAQLIWSRTEISTATKGRIFCKPYGENIKGVHVNYILGDEVSSYRDHDIWFRYVVTRATAKRGSIAAISTPVSESDLMTSKLNRNPEYWHKTYPAIINGESIWPERFPVSWLKQREKEIGKSAFAQQYLCQIVPESEEIPFPYHALVACHDLDKKLFEKRIEGDSDPYYVGCDFALSMKGDWSAFVIGKKTSDNKIQVVNILRFRGMPANTQKDILASINSNYMPNRMLLDKSTFGEMFVKDLVAENLPVIGFPFTQENRNAAFSKAIDLVNIGNVVLPYSKEPTQTSQKIDNLEHELTHFVVDKTPKGMATYKSLSEHDDVAIAFILMLKAASEERKFLSYIRSR